MNDQQRICTNEECSFAEDGECIEGLSIEECPHLQINSERTTEESAEHQAQSTQNAADALSAGTQSPLDLKQASAVLCRTQCNVIAVVAPSHAGKTCLVAGVYDALQYDGGLDGITFADSDTLFPFERICHFARTSSENLFFEEEPRTRSSPEPLVFHLALSDEGRRHDLLITDRWGEAFTDLAYNPSLLEDYVELRRADVINVLIDGAELSDLRKHANAIERTRHLLRVLLGQEMHGYINLVLTKYDVVTKSSIRQRADEALASLCDEFSTHIISLSSHKVAARRQSDEVEPNFGLAGLVRSWCRPRTNRELQAEAHLPSRAFLVG